MNKKEVRWLPCACAKCTKIGGCTFLRYDHLEHAKAQRLAKEAGLNTDEGFIRPYKICSECRMGYCYK